MRERGAAIAFMAPAGLLMAAVAALPMALVVWLSFFRRIPIFGISRFVGVENYAALLGDGRFWNSLLNTVIFAVLSVGIEVALGLAVALALHASFRGRGPVRAVMLLPWAIPTVVAARMWQWMFDADLGLLNGLLRLLGITEAGVNWLGDPTLALLAAVLADVWKATPFVAILLIAGLQTIPADQYRAAAVDGANRRQMLRYITMPGLRPALTVAILFRLLDAFRVFDIIFVLTGGGPADSTETLSIYTYKVLFQTMQFGYGSALAVAAVLCVSAFGYGALRALGLSNAAGGKDEG